MKLETHSFRWERKIEYNLIESYILQNASYASIYVFMLKLKPKAQEVQAANRMPRIMFKRIGIDFHKVATEIAAHKFISWYFNEMIQ